VRGGVGCTAAVTAACCCPQARFWTEIYEGAKLFYLSGLQYGKYLNREVLNLARFISVMKFRPLAWRTTHPYLIADRFEVGAAACLHGSLSVR
jgi:hypothetical protein